MSSLDHIIQGNRINAVLGDNELRDYLANKLETGALRVTSGPKQDLRDYKHPYGEHISTLLIAPPITIPRSMQKRCIPPLGLSYIAAALELHGLNVSMLDCVVEGYEQEEQTGTLITYGLSPENLEARLRKMEPPNVVGLSVLFSTDLHNLNHVARIVKKVFPDVVTVVGGLHATIYPREIFEIDQDLNGKARTIDWVIRGEGELRFADFLKLLKRGKIDRQADGLVGFIDGEFFCNPQKQMIDKIDNLPFPAYHLLPMEKYFNINIPFSPVPAGNRVVAILASRGCPVGCTFCASTNMYKKYRHRSVQNVMQEIFRLKELYGVDEIQFADDNLTFNRAHSMELFGALKEAGLKWCTPNGTMINSLTPELLDLMVKSGLYQITLSVDSGNSKTLKNLHHKPVNLSSIPGLIAKAKEYGVFTHGTLVVGMPGETIEDIKEGFEFVKNNLAFTSISVFIAAAIPGSELYHQALEKGLITREEARQIDTTKNKMRLSDIDARLLEKMAFDFQSEFTEAARRRDPDEYYRKYQRLIEAGRLKGVEVHGGRLT